VNDFQEFIQRETLATEMSEKQQEHTSEAMVEGVKIKLSLSKSGTGSTSKPNKKSGVEVLPKNNQDFVKVVKILANTSPVTNEEIIKRNKERRS